MFSWVAVGRSPPMSRLAVVLPAPLGPRSATISPGWTSNDTSSRAMVPLKRRVRCRTSITRRAYVRYELAFVGGGCRSLAARPRGDGARPLLHGSGSLGPVPGRSRLGSHARIPRRRRDRGHRVDRAGRARVPGVLARKPSARAPAHPVRVRGCPRHAAGGIARPRPRSPRPVRRARPGGALHRGTRDPGHHHGMTTDVAPAIDEHPDTSPAALQALRGDFLYFNVAGSGPTFPASPPGAQRFRTLLHQAGKFGQLRYAAFHSAPYPA